MKIFILFLSIIFTFAVMADERITQDNGVVIGKKTSTLTKCYKAEKGTGTKASLCFDTSDNKWKISTDDVTFNEISTASGATTDVGSLSSAIPNFLSNAGFELGTVNWTASGGTFTTTTTAANVGYGTRSGSWDPTATNQTLTSDQVTISSGVYGSPCLAEIYYKGGDAGMQLQAIDGSLNVLGTVSMPSTASYAVTNVSFACPSSGTFALRVKSTLADGALTYLDKAYLGENYYRKRDWLIDVNIFGANVILNLSGVPNYTELTNSSLQMEYNTSKGSLDSTAGVQIPCSASNPSTGSTCSSGSESVGIVYPLPGPQKVEVCASFSHTLYLENINADFETVFQLIETPNTDSSPGSFIQEGGTRLQSEIGAPVTNNEQSYPHTHCDIFNHTTGGIKTIRLMYTQSISTTVTNNKINAARDLGNRDIHITVRPL